MLTGKRIIESLSHSAMEKKITQGNGAVYWEGISWLCMTVMGEPCRDLSSEKTWNGNKKL